MDARLRRIVSDYEQVMKDFSDHKYIVVTPVGAEPPEKYHVTYYVNGIYLLEDGKIETLGKHEVNIELHADYPRYKPVCTIETPIWHPNFRDGQICIGDIWGAGESLSDIIINIGDMIQYKSWNSSSPLSADAAKWALENKHLFPVGDIDLFVGEDTSGVSSFDIDLFDENGNQVNEAAVHPVAQESFADEKNEENDFEITADELKGIEYVPIAQRMQGAAPVGDTVKVKINLKTVLAKGVLWALIGAIVGFGFGEIFQQTNINSTIASSMGYRDLARYYKYKYTSDQKLSRVMDDFKAYCKENGLDPEDEDSTSKWMNSLNPDEILDSGPLKDYIDANKEATEQLYEAYQDDFDMDEDDLSDAMDKVVRWSSGIWSAAIALFIGMFLGIGEGIYYGSKENAMKYGAIGAGISVVIGLISGNVAQNMYSSMLPDDPSPIAASLVRGLGWAIMGLGVGLAVSLIKPELKRIVSCLIGGFVGAFIGGFIFNFVGKVIPNDIASRGIGTIIMGILIGVGVGLLEQFAKSAWLKVIRGEFEGKEYLVFAGTTSIGNNSKNSIVLFKDKLVAPHHCDIVLEGSKYVLIDAGTPMGTLVNGMRTNKKILVQGDAIAVGNSVLIFNTK